ncbi:hypothetical protein PF005_g11626 [Phytophthora fragariae]|uniref:RxLR effector protein n=1 Tax=Phytophthora fragariae TaxID=53985 RepID=A0A6A3EYY4_9STRA|nr:hypothetical protein PF009_g12821 [Phytophthora fragariae]KAE9093875.1 hypothetical protein PF010_g17317 [Phytophthora fragariae]KAE9097757.1 hypothetical protein PF007_g16512 [Phytophthora fragariae]KAE9136367.1 hypothetical protein PF006_g14401 [Phytophthora fragariae]KAE9206350.1 hypothetical protein PF004_g17322 [Phytophthora fragariae]
MSSLCIVSFIVLSSSSTALALSSSDSCPCLVLARKPRRWRLMKPFLHAHDATNVSRLRLACPAKSSALKCSISAETGTPSLRYPSTHSTSCNSVSRERTVAVPIGLSLFMLLVLLLIHARSTLALIFRQ